VFLPQSVTQRHQRDGHAVPRCVRARHRYQRVTDSTCELNINESFSNWALVTSECVTRHVATLAEMHVIAETNAERRYRDTHEVTSFPRGPPCGPPS
jgi:hypothetical protein